MDEGDIGAELYAAAAAAAAGQIPYRPAAGSRGAASPADTGDGAGAGGVASQPGYSGDTLVEDNSMAQSQVCREE